MVIRIAIYNNKEKLKILNLMHLNSWLQEYNNNHHNNQV